MDLLGELQNNLEKSEGRITDNDDSFLYATKTYAHIVKDMQKKSKLGHDTFVFDPSKVPTIVDNMMRQDGMIVWRNSFIVKYVIPKKED